MFYLRANTASQVVEIGPFLSSSDAFTPVASSVAMAAADIQLNKHGSTAQVSKNSGGGTYIANGWYYTTLDATDTNTVGRLKISINTLSASTLAMPVWLDTQVVSSSVYDSYFSTGVFPVDVVRLAGSTSGANNMSSAANSIISGTATTGTLNISTATVSLYGVSIPTDGQLQGRQIVWKGDVTAGLRQQATTVSTYTAASSTMVFVPTSVAPVNGDTFTIF